MLLFFRFLFISPTTTKKGFHIYGVLGFVGLFWGWVFFGGGNEGEREKREEIFRQVCLLVF